VHNAPLTGARMGFPAEEAPAAGPPPQTQYDTSLPPVGPKRSADLLTATVPGNPSAPEAAASMTPEAPAAASLDLSPPTASLALSPTTPAIDIINSEPSATTVFGEARVQAGAFGGAAAEAKAGDLSSPPDTGAIIPPQASGGSQFRLDESGRIDLVPDPPANTGRRQRELYDELRHKTRELSELGHNQLGDLSAPIDRFREALLENIETVSITRLWSRGNTLRRRLDAHEIAVGSAEPSDPARLTLLVAGRLRDLAETFNVFIVSEPEGSVLEQARLGPEEREAKRAIVVAAEPIVEALQTSPDVATQSAAQALSEQIEAAQDALSAAGVNGDQAVALAGNSIINAVITLLRRAAWGEAAFALEKFRHGVYATAGGGAAWLAWQHLPSVQFIVDRATELKVLVEAAFHNPALGHVIDAIVQAASSLPPI
jgi:hypothetical protein